MTAPTKERDITQLSVPIKIVGPIIGTIVATSLWLQTQLWEIKASMGTAWTIHDQREWAHDAKEKNPTLIIPNPDEVFWKSRSRRSTSSAAVQFDGALATKE